jgi:hypothetical protein
MLFFRVSESQRISTLRGYGDMTAVTGGCAVVVMCERASVRAAGCLGVWGSTIPQDCYSFVTKLAWAIAHIDMC